MPADSSLIGRRISAYELVSVLGSGGMATVYRGFDHNLQRQVAIKIVPSSAAEPQLLDRFQQEARLLASLRHPHIVQVYDFGEQDGLTYIVQELLPGPSLGEQIKERAIEKNPFTPREIITIGTHLASALDAAHDAGVVHRDIKPENAIWNAHGMLILTDFGIARSLFSDVKHTQTGTVIGTPHYLSPEQAQGRTPTPTSDIYSLGIVIYELIAGDVPFDDDSAMRVVIDHIQSTPSSLRQSRPDLPLAVDEAVQQALAKLPEQRFKRAGAFMRALEQSWMQPSAGGQALPAAPPTAPDIPVHEQATRVWQPDAAPPPNQPPHQPPPRQQPPNQLPPNQSPPRQQPPRQQPASAPQAYQQRSPDNQPRRAPLPSSAREQADRPWQPAPPPRPGPDPSPAPQQSGGRQMPSPGMLIGGLLGVLLLCGVSWMLVSNTMAGFGGFASAPIPTITPNPAFGEVPTVAAFETSTPAPEAPPTEPPPPEPTPEPPPPEPTPEPPPAAAPEPAPVLPDVPAPEAGTLYFASNRNGDFDIFAVNTDASEPRAIVTDPGDDFGPQPQPGGGIFGFFQGDGQLAFHANRAGSWDIFLRADDGTITNLTNSPDVNDQQASWSPDGGQLAFRSSPQGTWDIARIDAGGGALTQLTSALADDFAPRWSPDGQTIAFTSNRDGNDEIYLINADGSNERRLTESPANDKEPAWSPDGQTIAFTSNRDGNDEIYLMNADGSDQRNITNHPGQDSQATWSPDGQFVAVTTDRDGNLEVYITSLDGAFVLNATQSPAADLDPAWSP